MWKRWIVGPPFALLVGTDRSARISDPSFRPPTVEYNFPVRI
jgi:hypothetical protein